MQRRRHERLARAGRRVQHDVLVRHELEQGLLLRRIEREPRRAHPGRVARVDRVRGGWGAARAGKSAASGAGAAVSVSGAAADIEAQNPRRLPRARPARTGHPRGGPVAVEDAKVLGVCVAAGVRRARRVGAAGGAEVAAPRRRAPRRGTGRRRARRRRRGPGTPHPTAPSMQRRRAPRRSRKDRRRSRSGRRRC